MNIGMDVILGAVLLGLASGLMLLFRGQILGCSGILFRIWDFTSYKVNVNNLMFLLGLILSGLLFNLTHIVPNPLSTFKTAPGLLFLGGILVGGGTYLGGGCTSGHGLCGLSLGRRRSIIAVAIFFPVAICAAWLVH